MSACVAGRCPPSGGRWEQSQESARLKRLAAVRPVVKVSRRPPRPQLPPCSRRPLARPSSDCRRSDEPVLWNPRPRSRSSSPHRLEPLDPAAKQREHHLVSELIAPRQMEDIRHLIPAGLDFLSVQEELREWYFSPELGAVSNASSPTFQELTRPPSPRRASSRTSSRKGLPCQQRAPVQVERKPQCIAGASVESGSAQVSGTDVSSFDLSVCVTQLKDAVCCNPGGQGDSCGAATSACEVACHDSVSQCLRGTVTTSEAESHDTVGQCDLRGPAVSSDGARCDLSVVATSHEVECHDTVGQCDCRGGGVDCQDPLSQRSQRDAAPPLDGVTCSEIVGRCARVQAHHSRVCTPCEAGVPCGALEARFSTSSSARDLCVDHADSFVSKSQMCKSRSGRGTGGRIHSGRSWSSPTGSSPTRSSLSGSSTSSTGTLRRSPSHRSPAGSSACVPNRSSGTAVDDWLHSQNLSRIPTVSHPSPSSNTRYTARPPDESFASYGDDFCGGDGESSGERCGEGPEASAEGAGNNDLSGSCV